MFAEALMTMVMIILVKMLVLPIILQCYAVNFAFDNKVISIRRCIDFLSALSRNLRIADCLYYYHLNCRLPKFEPSCSYCVDISVS